jgi:hypothetical protein
MRRLFYAPIHPDAERWRLRIMNKPTLSLRFLPGNANHHLWNNNGTWFMHYTVHPDALTKQRVRASLGTKSLAEARRRRDALLNGLGTD